jgi:hypothetical protein
MVLAHIERSPAAKRHRLSAEQMPMVEENLALVTATHRKIAG